VKTNGEHHNFIVLDHLFSVPALYLASGLFLGITLGTHIQIFDFKLNFATVITIMVSLFLTNRYSKILSLIIAVFIGIIFQNSWEKSMEIGEKAFAEGNKIKIWTEFYSPPRYRDEKEMEQSATISGTDYRINLILKGKLTDSVVLPGEKAQIIGVFRNYDKQNNAAPWEYDKIFQEKIKNSIGEIEVISITKHSAIPPVTALYRHIRKNFAQSRYESLYISIFTGDRSFLTPDINAFFRESGLIHFLAISGLHIAILIIAFSTVFYILPLPKIMRNCAVIVLVLLLPFAAGFNPATIRAVIMGTLLLISPLFNKKNCALNSLFCAMFVILSLYPMHLFLIGFQYSFAAMFAVIILSKIVEGYEHPVYPAVNNFTKIISFAAMPIFLFLATAPIQVYHFGTITWSAPFANLFLLPALQIICQIALVSLFIPLFATPNFLLTISDALLGFLFTVINKYVIWTGLAESQTDISPLVFVAIIMTIIIFRTFKRHKIIYVIYSYLFITTLSLLWALLKKDAIYTVSYRNFRMKLLDGAYPVVVILGGAQTGNYYNPAFLRWVKTHADGSVWSAPRKAIFISDGNYVPSSFSKNFNHIVVLNASGEVYFDTPQDTAETSAISLKEKSRGKTPFKKEYIETQLLR
jgi:ComEC/Rec2-related protein